MNEEFIPIEQCKHRRLYRVRARNFRLGVYDEKLYPWLKDVANVACDPKP